MKVAFYSTVTRGYEEMYRNMYNSLGFRDDCDYWIFTDDSFNIPELKKSNVFKCNFLGLEGVDLSKYNFYAPATINPDLLMKIFLNKIKIWDFLKQKGYDIIVMVDVDMVCLRDIYPIIQEVYEKDYDLACNDLPEVYFPVFKAYMACNTSLEAKADFFNPKWKLPEGFEYKYNVGFMVINANHLKENEFQAFLDWSKGIEKFCICPEEVYLQSNYKNRLLVPGLNITASLKDLPPYLPNTNTLNPDFIRYVNNGYIYHYGRKATPCLIMAGRWFSAGHMLTIERYIDTAVCRGFLERTVRKGYAKNRISAETADMLFEKIRNIGEK